jgi:hypothetical protein
MWNDLSFSASSFDPESWGPSWGLTWEAGQIESPAVASGAGNYRVSPRRQRGFHYPYAPLAATARRNDDALSLLLIGAL